MENRTLKLSMTEMECYEEFDKKNLRRILQIIKSGVKIKKPLWSAQESPRNNYDQYTFDFTFDKKEYCVIIRNEHNTKEFMISLYEYGENNFTADFKQLSKYSPSTVEIVFNHYKFHEYVPKVYPTKRKKYPYGSFEERERKDAVGSKSTRFLKKSQSALAKIYQSNHQQIDNVNFKHIDYYFGESHYPAMYLPDLKSWLEFSISILNGDAPKLKKHSELVRDVAFAIKVRKAYENEMGIPPKMPSMSQQKNPDKFKVANGRFIAKQNIKNYIESGLQNDLLFQKINPIMEIVDNSQNAQSALQISFSDYANLYWDNRLMELRKQELELVKQIETGFAKYRTLVNTIVNNTMITCQEELSELERRFKAINPNFRFVFRYIDDNSHNVHHQFYRYIGVADYEKCDMNYLDEMTQEEWDNLSPNQQSNWEFDKQFLPSHSLLDDLFTLFNIDPKKFCAISKKDMLLIEKEYENLVGNLRAKLTEVKAAMESKAKEQFISAVRMSVLEAEMESDNTLANKFAQINQKLQNRITSSQNILTSGTSTSTT